MRQFKADLIEPHFLEHLEPVLKGEYSIGYKVDFKTILDLGGNIGAFTFWASQVYPTSFIYAYEPDPDNCKRFLKNMELSALPKFRYELNQVAVIESPEPFITLYKSKVNCGMNSVIASMADVVEDQFEVATFSPRKLPVADLLKVDTEGCEINIIANYLEYVCKPSQISFEFHCAGDRLLLEDMLRPDYILSTGKIRFEELGTLNFVHRDRFKYKK